MCLKHDTHYSTTLVGSGPEKHAFLCSFNFRAHDHEWKLCCYNWQLLSEQRWAQSKTTIKKTCLAASLNSKAPLISLIRQKHKEYVAIVCIALAIAFFLSTDRLKLSEIRFSVTRFLFSQWILITNCENITMCTPNHVLSVYLRIFWSSQKWTKDAGGRRRDTRFGVDNYDE